MLACDFFRSRDHRSQNHPRSVLHRTGSPKRPSDRLHGEPQLCLGYPTNLPTDLGIGERISRESLPHPGQRQEVPRSFRFGVRFQRDRDCEYPVSGRSGERIAERWVRSVHEECLDRIMIMSECHLCRVLQKYIEYCSQTHPHQGICQQFSISGSERSTDGLIHRRNVLGGIIHNYYRQPPDLVTSSG
jgi:hypothetical protein